MQIVGTRAMLSIIVVGVLALALGLWWFLSGPRELPQAISTNACTADEAYYIVMAVASAGEEVTVRTRAEVSPSALRFIFSDPNGNVKMEKIRIGDATQQQQSALASAEPGSKSDEKSNVDPALIPANFTRHATNPTIYCRLMEGGTWTEWVNEREEPDYLVDGPGSCGSPMGQLTGLTRLRTEVVDGVPTTKYTAMLEFNGDTTETGPLDHRADWWVESLGRLKRKSLTHLAYNSKEVVIYSDYGWVNDITIPGTSSTPTPEPAASATSPSPTSRTTSPTSRTGPGGSGP